MKPAKVRREDNFKEFEAKLAESWRQKLERGNGR